MDVTAGGGTEAVSDSHGDDNRCCLSDDVILRLAKLGIKVLIIFSLYLNIPDVSVILKQVSFSDFVSIAHIPWPPQAMFCLKRVFSRTTFVAITVT